MKGGIRVTGLDKAIQGLNKELNGIAIATKAELIRLGLGIQRRAQENITDDNLIDTGNLRASAFTVWNGVDTPAVPDFNTTGIKTGGKDSRYMNQLKGSQANAVGVAMADTEEVKGENGVCVVVGFGAFYALFVHEDGVTRNWTGSKFLERAVLDAKKDAVSAMAGALKRR